MHMYHRTQCWEIVFVASFLTADNSYGNAIGRMVAVWEIFECVLKRVITSTHQIHCLYRRYNAKKKNNLKRLSKKCYNWVPISLKFNHRCWSHDVFWTHISSTNNFDWLKNIKQPDISTTTVTERRDCHTNTNEI